MDVKTYVLKNESYYFSIFLKPGNCKNKKKWYKTALQEAYLLYGYSREQRLEMCYLSKQGICVFYSLPPQNKDLLRCMLFEICLYI